MARICNPNILEEKGGGPRGQGSSRYLKPCVKKPNQLTNQIKQTEKNFKEHLTAIYEVWML